jgi:phosphoribosylformylglycinamidine cyclo-ligase
MGLSLLAKSPDALGAGGETPVLRGLIEKEASLLSGSATGFISSVDRLINPANIQDGDAIILFESSGPHANGYTMLWDVLAPRLPDGYMTKIPNDGRTFGEAILAPTIIYSQAMRAILDAGVSIHYAVNITGHGWCKLMRAVQPFTYVIDTLPRQQPLFDLIHQYNPVDEKKMYRTYNMGAGFAIYVSQKDVASVLHAVESQESDIYSPVVAGYIVKSSAKRVVINPKNIAFDAEDLAIR